MTPTYKNYYDKHICMAITVMIINKFKEPFFS